jgi:anthranilate phosphoribosyltransferase
MFAPNFHGAMKYAAPVRKELGVRTVFNVLGPLTNPAGADNQVMGVFHPDLVGIQARVLQRLGSRHVLVVHGSDGLDEITISGTSYIAELKNGEVKEYTVTPEDFGLKSTSLDSIRVANAAEAKAMLLGVLDNQTGAARDIVLLNAGAAIYVAGLTDTLAQGVKKADEALSSGAAKSKLEQLIQVSNVGKQ